MSKQLRTAISYNPEKNEWVGIVYTKTWFGFCNNVITVACMPTELGIKIWLHRYLETGIEPDDMYSVEEKPKQPEPTLEEILDKIYMDPNTYIFVFGSNEAGIHGAGAARTAYRKYGAVYGIGYGHQGNTFAIPTMDRQIRPLMVNQIKKYVDDFMYYAVQHPELTFKVTCIGCGLGGKKDADMASLFINAPGNCYFDTKWEKYLPGAKFWGTF